MKKLKILLQYDSSRFIHIGIVVVIYYILKTSYIGFILLIPEIIFLFKNSKNILIYSIIIILIISIRFTNIDNNAKPIDSPVSGKIIEVYDNSFLLKNNDYILCYYDQLDDLMPGKIVSLDGYELDGSTYDIPHAFDKDIYLKSRNISNIFYVDELKIESNTFNIGIFKYKVSRYIDEIYNETTASYLKLFILGDNYLSDKINNITVNLGITHLFAISGMHLALIIGFIKSILRRLNFTKESIDIFIILILVIYNIITGFKISILRASLLVITLVLSKNLKLFLTKSDIITFIFIGFLIFNPYIFYSLGFELSFLISLSIMMSDYLFKNDIPIKKIIKITIIATLISLPLTLEINNQLCLMLPFTNLFFILFISYIFLPLSYIVITFPFLKRLYYYVCLIFEKTTELFSKINMIINFNLPSNLHKLLYIIIVFMILINYKKAKKMITYAFLLIFLCLISINFNYISNRFVRFLDVDQGDAIHIHDNGCDMLIDTGDKDYYNNLIKYFKANNTYEIDILLITHFHSDHFGELEDLVNSLNVKTIYLNSDINNLSSYQLIKTGDCFSCGKANFQVISAGNNDANENNNSIVLYAEIGSHNYLFTGDIEEKIENIINDSYTFEIDILKVPHHGSNTSSTDSFIKSLNGDLAIISVGESNKYDFPSSEVLKTLKSYNYEIFRTDEHGTITIYYLGYTDIILIELYKKQKRNRYIIRDI